MEGPTEGPTDGAPKKRYRKKKKETAKARYARRDAAKAHKRRDGVASGGRKLAWTFPELSLRGTDGAARGRLALNPQTQEPSQPVLASVEASTLTISVLVWHSHEFVDRGVYLEI